MLDAADKALFREQGYLHVPGVVSPAELAAMRAALDGWIEESRSHDRNWGDTPDGKARFDLEAGHTAERPKLRRPIQPTCRRPTGTISGTARWPTWWPT